MSAGFRWSSIVLLSLACSYSSAQVVQTGRVELVVKGHEENYTAIGLGSSGMMLYRRVAGKKDDEIEFSKLDTALRQQWNGKIVIEKNLVFLRAKAYKDRLFILLSERGYLGGDFKLLEVFVETGQFADHTIRNLIPFGTTDFLLTDQAALIGGYFNYRPLVLYYNLRLKQSRVLPGFFNEPGELNQLKTNEDGSVDIIVCSRNLDRKKALWIRNYSSEGELIKTTLLNPPEDKHLLFGRSVQLGNGEQIVAGVYGRFSEYSRGIFMAGINSVGEYHIDYYNYAELKNFFSYMKDRKQKRVKERIERKTIRGKKIKFNYRFLIHDLIPYKNQYIMAGEAFYPHYTYPSTRYTYRSLGFGNTVPGQYSPGSLYRNDMIFDGYQYTHAVVIGFSQQGKLLWDNSFEINDIRTMRLDHFVNIHPDADRIVMMYLFKNALRAKIIRDDQVLEGKTTDEIGNKAYRDLSVLDNEHLDYWFGPYFYAYGAETVQHPFEATKKIFFVSKITYR